jgi:hypothetical protein
MAKSKKSLTRESFFKDLKIEPIEVELDGVIFYVRPMSELKRSQRYSAMFDKAGNIDPKFMEKRRVLSLIDHLCDENGEPLFTEKDIKALQDLDSVQIDPYFAAIDEVLGAEEGND